jgi:F-type H+-transporting ATPase subunit delta
MKAGRIAVRYAKALFLAARDQGVLDTVRDDMETILTAVTDLAEMRLLLESPVVETRKKTSIVVSLFEGKVGDLALDFLRLVTSKGREEYLDAMCRHYIRLYKAEKGIKIAQMETARPLSKEIRQKMVSLIAHAFNADIELVEEVKTDLIGGFVLRVEDQQLDSSVKGKLGRIRKQLQKS